MKPIERRKFISLSLLGSASLACFGSFSSANLREDNPLKEIYHFKIGEFNCINFNTGYYDFPVSLFFNDVPVGQIQHALGVQDPPDAVRACFSCIYIDTGTHRILLDSGVGTALGKPDLLQRYMLQERISCEDIDSTIISHAHADHVGGLLNDEGRLCFPNATYYSDRAEWEFYMDDESMNKAKADYPDFTLSSRGRQTYDKIRDRLVFVEPGTEIVPGIRVIDARGHTPGQLAVLVESQNEKLLYIADTVYHPLHIKYPGWLPAQSSLFDPGACQETNKRIFDRAAREKILVSATHFYPPPGLGYVVSLKEGWEWIPT